jgi:nucleotide-binding universal stress UspA family protein
MTFKKLLCAVDFSETSIAAVRAAAKLARRFDAELVLAHSLYIQIVAADIPYPDDLVKRMRHEATQGLAAAVRDAADAGAKRVSSKLVTGVPWMEIVGLAEGDPEIDLVVVGTHGRTGLRRFFLGSVAEKVARHAPCSVLAIHTGDIADAFRRVLCPVDFSESSRLAVEVGAKLVTPDGKLLLMHAIDAPTNYAGEPYAQPFLEDLDKRASAKLHGWAGELAKLTSATVDTRTRLGSPWAQAIALLEDDHGFDLVTIGSRGRTGIARFLLGSVAEKVVRHARCPVLVSRTRE